MRKLWWRFVHNVIAHGWLFLAELVGRGVTGARRFYGKTAALAWPPPADEVERRLEVWELLREAEQRAEIAGYEDLSDAIGLIATLWAAGFEDAARRALEAAAAPLFADLTAGEHQPLARGTYYPTGEDPEPLLVQIEIPGFGSFHGMEALKSAIERLQGERDAAIERHWPGTLERMVKTNRDGVECGFLEAAKMAEEMAAPGDAGALFLRLGDQIRERAKQFSTLTIVVLLALLTSAVCAEPPYKRPAWRDDDHDCRSTRVEVILRSCAPVALSRNGCRVVRATCPDLYTGAEISTDTPAQSLQIDHLFPAAVAHARKAWTEAAFSDFFNDQRNLVVCRSRTNGRKSDLMPDRWCPGDPKARPKVARQFRRVVRAYGFRISKAEEAGLVAWERGTCAPRAKVIG